MSERTCGFTSEDACAGSMRRGGGSFSAAAVAVVTGVVALCVLVVPAAAASAGAGGRARFERGGQLGLGCDPSRPAVAHYAGGVLLRHQPRFGPIPCMTFVGRAVDSAMVGVTRSGSVIWAARDDSTATPPANVLEGPEFVVRSNDLGATWTALGSGGPTTGGLVPTWMSVDPRTSRVWFVTTLASECGARISWSDDDGSSWQTNQSVGCPSEGSERVFEGPAPPGGARPHGYPHVVYFCGNGIDSAPSVLYCYKSLDGGRSFTAFPSFPDPGPPGYCGVFHAAVPGTVGPDGSIYMPLDYCGELGVAISRDEGATWTRIPIVSTNIADLYITSAATDAAGNVYITWVAASQPQPATVNGVGLPYLVVSRDGGRTWSQPMMIAAPGVQQVRHTAVTASGIGRIAISYLGSTSADPNAAFGGFITESNDVLRPRPVFWSASVNDPSQPLIAQPLISGPTSEPFGNRLFFISDAFGLDRTPWAAFECADQSACPNERVGVAARLALP
jgi:hypothetical protein